MTTKQKFLLGFILTAFCILLMAAGTAIFWSFAIIGMADKSAQIMDSKIVSFLSAVFSSLFILSIATMAVLANKYRALNGRQAKLKYFTTKNIAYIATFTAISSILYMIVKFPLPIFPSFLDMQISDMPALLAGFMMGPLAGCIVTILKILLKLPLSSTMFVGELGDLLLGLAFVLPSSLIYKYNKTKKGAFWGLGVAILTSTATAVLINAFILIPFYVQIALSDGWNTLLGMVRALYPNVTRQTFFAYYLPLAVLPFNILRGLTTAFVTFLLYKQLHRFFERLMPQQKKAQPQQASSDMPKQDTSTQQASSDIVEQ